MLGEKLGDGGERSAVDLLPALVDFLFLLGLPELVDPAQAVVGGEDLDGRLASSFSRGSRSLRGELDLQQHVVGAEDLRQHPAGITGRQHEAVRGVLGGASSSHSSRLTATPSGCMSRWFSARKRANSIRCQYS